MGRLTRRYILPLVLICVFAIVISCGGGRHAGLGVGDGGGTELIPEMDANAGHGLFRVIMAPQPPLETGPKLASLAEASSILAQVPPFTAHKGTLAADELIRQGSAYDTGLPNKGVSRAGETCVFNPQGLAGQLDEIAYASFVFTLPAYTPPAGLCPTLGFTWGDDVDWALGDDTARYYVGFADYTRGHWLWYQGDPDDVLTIEQDRFAECFREDGTLLVLVAVVGTGSFELSQLQIGQFEERATGALDPRPEDEAEELAGLPDFGGGGTLPDFIDLSGGGAMSAVRDQRKWSSCTTFAVGDAALNYEFKRLYGADDRGWSFKNEHNLVSPKYLFLKTDPGTGTGGRYMSDVLRQLKTGMSPGDWGTGSEQAAPYDYVYQANWGQDARDDAALLKIRESIPIPLSSQEAVNNVKIALAVQQHPVVLRVNIDPGLFLYQAGSPPWMYYGPSQGAHAMCIVGYNDHLGAHGAFKVRNSWGPYWGDEGYFWMDYAVLTTAGAKAACWVLELSFDAAVAQHFCGGVGVNGPPANVTTSRGTRSDVLIAWEAPAGTVDGYVIYRDLDGEQQPQQLGTAPADELYFSDTTLVEGDFATHTYWVSAIYGAEESALSAPVLGYRGAAPVTPMLDAAPPAGNALPGTPLLVTLAATSYDPDGGWVKYTWDSDYDGSFDGVLDSVLLPTQQVQFTTWRATPYQVMGRATDNEGEMADSAPFNIYVGGPPTASFTPSKLICEVGESVTFNGSASADSDTFGSGGDGQGLTQYSWDFGDGQTGSGSSVAHAFTAPGNKQVSLTVTDNEEFNAGSAEMSISIQVNAPPLADLDTTPAAGPAPLSVVLDATDSSDPDGTLEDYAWDFNGDGKFSGEAGALPEETSAQGNATFTFEYTVQNTYLPQVRVTDDDGAQATAGAVVTVGNAPPTVVLTADPTFGDTPLPVDFIATPSDPDGDAIIDYEWDFDGDGIYNEAAAGEDAAQGIAAPTNTYSNGDAQTFPAKVRVTDVDGDKAVSNTVSISTNGSPVAVISASPLTGVPPLTVLLDASNSHDNNADGYITTFEWDWEGDGTYDYNSGNDSTINHEFATAAKYDTTVLVTDNDGNQHATAVSPAINVNNQPIADLIANPAAGEPPLTVTLDASGSSDLNGPITKYEFDFGEGGGWVNNGTDATIQHEYTAANTYTASVRVTDNQDDTAVDTVQVNVNEVPVADLFATPAAGDAPLLVSLNASNSIDNDGAIADYEWDFDNDGSYNEAHNGEDLVQGDQIVSHTFAAGIHDPVVKVTDNDGSFATASVQVAVNDPPVPDVQVDATAKVTPATFNFDATGSVDNDGTIDDWEWDFDGDGVYNEAGDEAAAHGANQPTATYATPEPNGFTVTLRVTDNDSSQRTDTVHVTPGIWHLSGIVAENQVWTDGPVLTQVNGRPAFVYGKGSDNLAYYVRANDANGSTWGTPVAIGDVLGGGPYSLIIANGNPAVLYKYGSYQYFVRSDDVNGASWPAATQVSFMQAYTMSQAIIVNGNPAVAYHSSDGSGNWYSLYYIRATNSNGTAWGAPVKLEGNNVDEYTGFNPKLAIINGNPAIAYINYTYEDLKYIRASDSNGSTWGSAVYIGEIINYNRFAFTSVNNRPAVCWDDTSLEFQFSRADDANGSSWPATPTLICYGGYTSTCNSIEIFNGRPSIVVNNGSTNLNCIFHSDDANGAGWPTWQTRYTGSGSLNAFTLIGGKISAVLYDNSSNQQLSYITFY